MLIDKRDSLTGEVTEGSIGHYIGSAHNMIRKVFIQYLKDHGLSFTPEQLVILKRLSREEGLTQNEIASYFLRDSASITRIIDSLEKKDLVIRKKIATDRRANQVCITPTGKAVLMKIFPLAKELNGRFLEGIEEEEFALFQQVISKILQNAEKVTEQTTKQNID